MSTDDDDENMFGLYEDGEWVWDDHCNGLFFSRTKTKQTEINVPVTKVVGPIEFREDIDILEQQRFKKRYQRKGVDVENDIVTLQDIKDVVLYTAPVAILTESVINMLHVPAAERFIRALILYCQYYLQVSEEMSLRSLELLVKVKTPNSIEVETEFRDNIEDLRILVAKEYSIMISGGEGYRKYHHMGPHKKRRSLSKTDLKLFETFLRITIQIVWVALGRKMLHKIEMEVHRIFKSSTFNVIEHKLQTDFSSYMSPDERFVLLGHCLKRHAKLNSQSPLANEIACHRAIDYRLFGLGVIKYPRLSSRLLYMEHALRTPETSFQKLKITLGIIGLPRSHFDPMLKLIISARHSSSASTSFKGASRSASKTSRSSKSVKSVPSVKLHIYPDIVLPPKSSREYLAREFPSQTYLSISCNDCQRRRWLTRLKTAAASKSGSRVHF